MCWQLDLMKPQLGFLKVQSHVPHWSERGKPILQNPPWMRMKPLFSVLMVKLGQLQSLPYLAFLLFWFCLEIPSWWIPCTQALGGYVQIWASQQWPITILLLALSPQDTSLNHASAIQAQGFKNLKTPLPDPTIHSQLELSLYRCFVWIIYSVSEMTLCTGIFHSNPEVITHGGFTSFSRPPKFVLI